jgi:two-component system phosphate regulon sensor histidine kinase PhoR
MKRSIFLKVFGGYLLVILIFTVLIFVLSSGLIRSFYVDTLSRDLENLGRSLKLKVIPLLEENRYPELDAFVKKFGKGINTRITVIDKEGVVLADSDEDPKIMENHKFRPEVYRALGGNVGESLRFSKTVKEEMLYIGLPVEKNGEIWGVLRVSLYVKDINLLFSSLRKNIWRIVLLITFVSLFAAFLFSRSLSNPIRELSNASRQIASGDFNAKVFLKKRDELRELAESFNFMTEEMKTLFAELSRQKEELNTIISSIVEGLLALDKEGKILLSNESFKNIVQSGPVEGKYYWEVVRKPEFGELIKKVQKEKKNYTEEIALDERIFLCSATFLPPREEMVITLHDLTEVKNVEKIKKDFIVNVSHELRTPLTAIKGFVDTLEEEFGDRGQNYLEIIKRHTDRLINIVKDLLLLSELEERDFKIEVEKINIKELIGNILKIFEPKLKDKNLNVELEAGDDLPLIEGDSFKLEQLFINIIDNAVNYTEKGKISISMKKEDRNISIEIRDTGIGIPKEHLSRIFERFYVVDKSRSKRLGGTGLGLSIVKHIALLHNGEVRVESIPGKGTKFTVLLPT